MEEWAFAKEEGEGQSRLTVRRCSDGLCLFIFATPLKQGGRFCCGSRRIWARSPGLRGRSQHVANLGATAVTFSVPLWSLQQLFALIMSPVGLSFQPQERSHCLSSGFQSLFLREDKITLYSTILVVKASEKIMVFWGAFINELLKSTLKW